jgi:thioredoxin reductase
VAPAADRTPPTHPAAQPTRQDVIVGGGPACLSAALFTAKDGLETVVFDDDGTWLHTAHLFTSLGVGSQDGAAFLVTARADGDGFGAERRQDEPMIDVATTDDGFRVTTGEGDHEADYLVVATGSDRDPRLSVRRRRRRRRVTMGTSIEDAHATGAMVRAEE